MNKLRESGNVDLATLLVMLPVIAIVIILFAHPEVIVNITGMAFGTGGTGSGSTSHCIVNVTTNACNK